MIAFEYDADQDRVYRYSEADARETIYVTELYQRHRDELTGEIQHHYYVPGIERIVASVDDTDDGVNATRTTHYLHVDHLGSTDTVSDELGVVEQRMSFDVWGKRRDAEDWSLPDEFAQLGAVNLGYTGHEAQEDGGLLNMGGRMYDPQLGRMASADPFVVAPNSTQGWNRYAYVLNQPLSLTDPSGFEPTERPAGDADSEQAKPPERDAKGMEGRGTTTQGPPKPREMQPGGSSEPKASQGGWRAGPRRGRQAPARRRAPAERWAVDLWADRGLHARRREVVDAWRGRDHAAPARGLHRQHAAERGAVAGAAAAECVRRGGGGADRGRSQCRRAAEW
ncbi:RHS repeat domain-containing protein [Enhygromyxa salina]|uniref:RHS repeat-associated core domain-containing protein n=1 Tax=Enhygromyxa salina TaxID=215803 RepID=A0A2S9YNH9_9BACT|nr:RHS repeat-associated core domain-containing protein [Enhygromyxa salina]PRQ06650.1 hypothetical protein ENSA7_35260 [Enhygromyxa salina]